MGPDRQPLGERAGGERLRPAMAFDDEQGLVLLCCRAGLFRVAPPLDKICLF